MTDTFNEANPEKAQKLYINVDYLKSQGKHQDALDILDEIIKEARFGEFPGPTRKPCRSSLSFDHADGAHPGTFPLQDERA